ncbi:MAG: DUF58 domain-containing protein [Nitrospinota bacterium]
MHKQTLPEEIIKQIRHIELSSRKLVDTLFSGEYHSAFKGHGIEFAEVRPYQPGDDVRSIDWNVTARIGEPYIKIFDETRELTVILMVDASASGSFGTKDKFKSELAAEVCATIAFSAIKNHDKVGLLIFSDHVELYIPPAKGRKHVLRLIRELLFFTPKGLGTDIKTALDRLNRTVKKKAIVFLVSDFEDSGFEKPLRVAGTRHDIIAVELSDPAEETLPDAGLITLKDAETGEEIVVDSSNEEFRWKFQRKIKRDKEILEKLFRSCKIDRIKISTGSSPVAPLIKFFKRREKRSLLGR